MIYIRKKEYTSVSQETKICTYYSMNQQYEKGVQKWKKTYLVMLMRVKWLK